MQNAEQPVLNDFLSEERAGAELNLGFRTLRKYRRFGTSPAYVKIGRKIMYPRAAITDWVESKVIKPVRGK